MNLNQADFAIKLGLESATAISKYEDGSRTPDKDKLIIIANLGNISLDELLTDDFNMICEHRRDYGQPVTVPPIHSAAALIPIPENTQPGIDSAIQAMADIKEIIDSGDPVLVPAIKANLHAFKRALYRERQIVQILEENKDLKKRMQNLEFLCKDIPDLNQKFETLQDENRALRTENNRLKSTYEAPDGSNGDPTYSEKQDVK